MYGMSCEHCLAHGACAASPGLGCFAEFAVALAHLSRPCDGCGFDRFAAAHRTMEQAGHCCDCLGDDLGVAA